MIELARCPVAQSEHKCQAKASWPNQSALTRAAQFDLIKRPLE